jgi:hypothetical protein
VRVDELIEILRDHPADAEVELCIVAPVSDDSDEIAVDRYDVAGVMPWEDEEGASVWLISADDDADIDSFLDALQAERDED